MKLEMVIAGVMLAATVSCGLVGYAAGLGFERARKEKEIAELVQKHERAVGDIDRKHREALEAEYARRVRAEAQHAVDMAELDTKHTMEREHAKRKTDSDIAAVRAGERRLRERFTCQGGGVAGASGAGHQAGASTGVGDGGAPRGLQREDAEVLLRIGSEADEVAQQLAACQGIVRKDRAHSHGL